MSLKSRPWSQEVSIIQEDDSIKQLVEQIGVRKWTRLSLQLDQRFGFKGRYYLHRTAKQCRERWHNHLNPSVNKEIWTEQQEGILFQAQERYGNKWSAIASHLPGRSDNAVKNHFYSTVRRNLRMLNRKKPKHERIEGPILELLKDPQIAKKIKFNSGDGICKRKRYNIEENQVLYEIFRRRSSRLQRNGGSQNQEEEKKVYSRNMSLKQESLVSVPSFLFYPFPGMVDLSSLQKEGLEEMYRDGLERKQDSVSLQKEESPVCQRGESLNGFNRMEIRNLLFSGKSESQFPPYFPMNSGSFSLKHS